MTVIGLTGGFGTGKTFVAKIFASLGAKVIDADKIAHSVIRRRTPEYKKIKSVFGIDIVAKSGDIDRRKLGNIIFSDKKCLKKLNAIVHPKVIKVIKQQICKAAGDKVVVIDAPLLVEAGLVGLVDKLIVVKSSRRAQVERCVRKFNIKKEDVLRMMRSQIPVERKIKMADFVIDNNGTRAETKKCVIKVWRSIWK